MAMLHNGYPYWLIVVVEAACWLWVEGAMTSEILVGPGVPLCRRCVMSMSDGNE